MQRHVHIDYQLFEIIGRIFDQILILTNLIWVEFFVRIHWTRLSFSPKLKKHKEMRINPNENKSGEIEKTYINLFWLNRDRSSLRFVDLNTIVRLWHSYRLPEFHSRDDDDLCILDLTKLENQHREIHCWSIKIMLHLLVCYPGRMIRSVNDRIRFKYEM